MFNRTYASTHHSTRIDVVQQPNDAADAARLHGEIKKQAEKEIIESVRIEGNDFFNVMLHIHEDCVSRDTLFRAVYNLNGQRIITNYTHQRDWLTDGDNRAAMIQGLMAKMAEDIAREILMVAIKPHLDARTF